MSNSHKWAPNMILTANYVHAHGSEPRGQGYWAFQFFTANWQACIQTMAFVDVIEFVPSSMTYTAAKRWACRRAVELSATNRIVRISLCS